MRALKRHAFEPLNRGTLEPLNLPDVTGRTKMLAAMSLALWAGAITAGRLMAYTQALR
jgi:hypothetical protein